MYLLDPVHTFLAAPLAVSRLAAILLPLNGSPAVVPAPLVPAGDLVTFFALTMSMGDESDEYKESPSSSDDDEEPPAPVADERVGGSTGNEVPPRLSGAELRREQARERRRARPPEVVAADAARAHEAYVRRRAAMSEAELDAARARARERHRNKTQAQKQAEYQGRKAAAAAGQAAASAAEQADEAERKEVRVEMQRCRRESVRLAAEAELLDADEGERLDAEHVVHPLAAERADAIYSECQQRLGWEGMGEAVCGVCQLLTPVARTVLLPPRAWPVVSMAQRLKPADDLPPELVAQYDLSRIFPESRSMLLSPLGVVGLGVGEDDELTSADTGADVVLITLVQLPVY